MSSGRGWTETQKLVLTGIEGQRRTWDLDGMVACRGVSCGACRWVEVAKHFFLLKMLRSIIKQYPLVYGSLEQKGRIIQKSFFAFILSFEKNSWKIQSLYLSRGISLKSTFGVSVWNIFGTVTLSSMFFGNPFWLDIIKSRIRAQTLQQVFGIKVYTVRYHIVRSEYDVYE